MTTDTASNEAQNSVPPSMGYPLYGKPDIAAANGRYWKCPVGDCCKSFKQLNGVIAHFHHSHETAANSIAGDPKRFKCPFLSCQKPYQNSNGLAYHLQKVHGEGMEDVHSSSKEHTPGNAPREYVCPHECGKAYRNSNGLAYHLKKSKCAQLHPLEDSDVDQSLRKKNKTNNQDQDSEENPSYSEHEDGKEDSVGEEEEDSQSEA